MAGVTTPGVEAARHRLTELGYEALVFHTSGSGGRNLESLAEQELFAGILDLTPSWLADDLGGRHPDRRNRPAAGRRPCACPGAGSPRSAAREAPITIRPPTTRYSPRSVTGRGTA
ncbi:hypothetical protein [Streptomyces sp. NPDC000880]